MKSLMPNFSFRFKLLLGMMLVVVGATGTTLYVSQKRMETAYQTLFAERFTGQIAVFNSMQDARLSAIKAKCTELTQSVRVQAALEATKESGESERLYQTTFNELDVRELAAQAIRQRRPMTLAFVRYTDEKGKELPPSAPLLNGRGFLAYDQLETQLEQVITNLASGPIQQVGYVSVENVAPNQPRFPSRARQLAAHQKKRTLVEVILTRVEDIDGKCMGSLIVGFHFINDTEHGLSDFSRIKSGIWSDNMLYTESLAPADAVEINSRMREMMEQKRSIKMQGTFDVDVAGEPHQVFFQLMNRDSNFTPTYQVSIYSMAEAIRDQQDLQRNIIMFGAILLMGSMLISVFLSNGFSAPIRELVAATGCVQDGDFKVRVPVRSNDEVGQLAHSFNEMTAELALKEKYRAVLDMVADKDVAHQMVHGAMSLGGEKREVSVIFCDIRGFTAHTQGMDPAEVIKMLNEHMTALTKVVYEHNGVVDKFVGDLIMAVFGAPKSYGDDAFNATRCAMRMIEERNKLNKISSHKIEVGIGIATGEAVAGCMGSADRLNYTVLGERVNLASRLCSVAGRGEVVIDETTRAKLSGHIDAEELPELKLKGFSDMVKAYKVTHVQPKK